ncbi:hypothetical protein FKM82_029398 [Ascaphus truei]
MLLLLSAPGMLITCSCYSVLKTRRLHAPVTQCSRHAGNMLLLLSAPDTQVTCSCYLVLQTRR